MRKRLLIWTALLSLAIIVFIYLNALANRQPGHILIVLGNHRFDMTFWTGLGLLLLTWLIIHFTVKVTKGSLKLTVGSVKRILFGSDETAIKRTNDGLVEFMEGNWKQAKRHLIRSADKMPRPEINYLAAARSAYELGERESAFELLGKAETAAPNNPLAVCLTQARMHFQGKQFEQCVASLERARELSPKHPVIIQLLEQVYLALGDWRSLADLLPEIKSQSPERFSDLERQIYSGLFEQIADTNTGSEELDELWQDLSRSARKDPMIAEAYIRGLIRQANSEKALQAINKTLSNCWSDGLIELYGLIDANGSDKQLVQAESWLREHPGSHTLLLSLGRLSLRQQLWGKAREYFEHSLDIKPTASAYAELARLLAHQDEHQAATEMYQKGLQLNSGKLPDLPMPH